MLKLLVLKKLIDSESKSATGCLSCVSRSDLTTKVKELYKQFSANVADLDTPLTDDQFYELTKKLMHHKSKAHQLEGLYLDLVSAMDLKDLIAKGLANHIDKFNSVTLKKAKENPAFYDWMLILFANNIQLKETHAFFKLNNEQLQRFLEINKEAKKHHEYNENTLNTFFFLYEHLDPEKAFGLALNLPFNIELLRNHPNAKIIFSIIDVTHHSYPQKSLENYLNLKT